MDFNFTPPTNKIKDPLKEFGRNLTDEAAKNNLDPVIGRDDEIRRIIRILSRKTKNNPILVGEPGVGKTAIVEGLARKIVAGDVPENLKSKEIIELDVGSLIAGASFQGQFEQRIKSVLKKIKESKGEIIVFIDEMHTLIGTGKNQQGGMDAAQLLKPMLARGELRLIGATTIEEHKKYIESDAAFERRLQKIMVNEPTQEETIAILRGLKERLEGYHGVKIHDSAIIAATKLSTRYITDRFLPDKAIDLIDEAAAGIQTIMNSKPIELEKLEQKFALLKMEEASIKGEKNDKTKLRIKTINVERAKIQESINKISEKWNKEKELLNDVKELKNKLDDAKQKQVNLLTEAEYEKAAELLYKEIPTLQKELDEKEQKAKNRENTLIREDVDEEEIANVVAKWTNIPVDKLLESQKKKILNLNELMSKRIIGQDEAINKVYETILRSKAGINDPERPIGSFIFMGPTGVGKTEIAKVLARELFNSEKNIVRIDMSEYSEKSSISKLIGSAPGYIGFDTGGQLTDAIKKHPYSIVLLDEIEKAHKEVLNTLLQVLDEGHLTDNRGKRINFKNTIVIMTTNIGAIEVLENKNKDKVINQLNKYLKPEFINRIDDIVVFEGLSEKSVDKISELELNKLISRLSESDFNFNISKSLIKYVSSSSFDPIYGARPIKRFIKKNIEFVIAKKIITGELDKKNYYTIDFVNNKITFNKRVFN